MMIVSPVDAHAMKVAAIAAIPEEKAWVAIVSSGCWSFQLAPSSALIFASRTRTVGFPMRV